MPQQFLKFFELVRNIGFEDAPDYIALRTLLAEMFSEKGYQNDFQYDWVLKAQSVPKKNRYHSLNQDRRKEFYQAKNNQPKGRNESPDHHKSGNIKKSNPKFQKQKHNRNEHGYKPYEKEAQGHRTQEEKFFKEQDPKFHKTGEGFYKGYRKENLYEHKNNKNFEEKPYKQKHYEQKNLKYTNWKREDKQENERGEEVKKPCLPRNHETKALFAQQLRSIQKIVSPDSQPTKQPLINSSKQKHEPKVTALVGSGIIGEVKNDIITEGIYSNDFMISTLKNNDIFNNEEIKGESAKESLKMNYPSSKNNSERVVQPGDQKASLKPSGSYQRDKRTNFRTSAAAMFSNQTGGGCSYTD